MLETDSNIIDNSHPAAEWNMVSTNCNHDSSSSSSTSSSSTLQINLKAVNQLTEVNENMNKKLDTLNSTVEILQYQMTGIRSVIRHHRDEIKTLSKPHSSPIPPRFNNKFQTIDTTVTTHLSIATKDIDHVHLSTLQPRNKTPVSSPRKTTIRTARKKTLATRRQ